MKQAKTIPTPEHTSSQFAQKSVVASLIGFFSLNARLEAAQAALDNSAQNRQELIFTADKAIATSKQRIVETDALIAESQALRK